ncbi:MAG TPA: ADP-ribosylglycohydrolase family protein [Puia sp.]|nr:ADP-ribosylglycohydrolase family protein [Puia sp.]
MKRLQLIICICVALLASRVIAQPSEPPKNITLTKAFLKDKIKGGWAGQTIGVTFGGPYEFRFEGSFIQDYEPLVWYDGYLKKTMLDNPGLYDDLYMDLTFVEVFEKYGLDAPVDSFANAFAHADYMLWHANQAARYNILNGIKPPASGYWLNNPHSDDIDYQIESDYAGLMSPGMPNTASSISDKIGHIMNYGDGWYGGVFIGAMYTLAFTSSDVADIVDQALRTIPEKSNFHQCIADVISWHRQYPADWHQTWLELQKKWSSDVGCPDGVFSPFDIDSKINSAYVVMGLLYGNGDFSKTLEIATRVGQDADCNPSSAGGILGALLGYEKIPAYWKMGLQEAEGINFKYTDFSLAKVYDISFSQALENIARHHGSISGENVTIAVQNPESVKFEQGFPGLYPTAKKDYNQRDQQTFQFDFDGTGYVLRGEAAKKNNADADYGFEAEVTIDGGAPEKIKWPTDFTTRRHDLCWKYLLPYGHHRVRVNILNPNDKYQVIARDYIVYNENKPASKDSISPQPILKDTAIYYKVDVEASFTGGEAAWKNFQRKHLYDINESQTKLSVLAQFVVDQDGKISDIIILKAPSNKVYSDETIRLIKRSSGNWDPAVLNAKHVKSYKTVRIEF